MWYIYIYIIIIKILKKKYLSGNLKSTGTDRNTAVLFKVGYCSKFCTVRALRFWNVRNFVGTGTFDRRSVLGFWKTVLLNLAVLNLAPKCSKKPRTFGYFHFYFHLPMYQKIGNVDTVQVCILLSSESSQMFEGSSNIWGMFFE